MPKKNIILQLPVSFARVDLNQFDGLVQYFLHDAVEFGVTFFAAVVDVVLFESRAHRLGKLFPERGAVFEVSE
jgi:hypothetical protein